MVMMMMLIMMVIGCAWSQLAAGGCAWSQPYPWRACQLAAAGPPAVLGASLGRACQLAAGGPFGELANSLLSPIVQTLNTNVAYDQGWQ